MTVAKLNIPKRPSKVFTDSHGEVQPLKFVGRDRFVLCMWAANARAIPGIRTHLL